MTNKCDVCGAKTKSSTGRCLTHKFAVRRAIRRIRTEGLVVDQAGGAWWIWNEHGEVLVIGESSRIKAIAALDLSLEVAS